ncbi:hypothetical protein OG539_06230 [Actinacidiphila glaucinigra]|uniref:hypothetical protein n=1 Tax=Actinacidiphila glaucinigra TaxID=235986 RepID=UPI003253540F
MSTPATWRAARERADGLLIHPVSMGTRPGRGRGPRALFDQVREALEDNGDLMPAQDAPGLLETGDGARVQRCLLRRAPAALRGVAAACARLTQA